MSAVATAPSCSQVSLLRSSSFSPSSHWRPEGGGASARTYEKSLVCGDKRFFIQEKQKANEGKELRAAGAARMKLELRATGEKLIYTHS